MTKLTKKTDLVANLSRNCQHKEVGNLFQSSIRHTPITLCKPLHVRKNRSAGFSVHAERKRRDPYGNRGAGTGMTCSSLILFACNSRIRVCRRNKGENCMDIR